MINKKISLSTEDSEIFLETFVPDSLERTKKAILVIPGGGYSGICDDREGEPIALAFLAHGFASFVLHYSTGRKRPYPAQLIEASLAIKHIKDCSEEYGIDPENVFVTGFSAGGHLSACLGTMWHRDEIYENIDMPFGYNKPKGMILCYPVISADENIRNFGSFQNLLCTDTPSSEELDYVSIENWIDEKSAPCFIMHTSNDRTVNVGNALAIANAYAKKGMTFELHIYPDAPHGVALGNEITKCGEKKWCNESISKWVENAVLWIDNI